MGLVLVTPPAVEPVALSDAKQHLRLEITADDTYVSGLITAARIYGENRLRRAFITQSWKRTLNYFPAVGFGYPIKRDVKLPLAPLVSVESVQYYDPQGNLQTMDTTIYTVDNTTEPGAIVLNPGKVWPVTQLYKPNAVTINYTVGYGDATAVPQNIKQGIMMCVAHWYEQRTPYIVGQTVAEVPMAADSLFDLSDYGSYMI